MRATHSRSCSAMAIAASVLTPILLGLNTGPTRLMTPRSCNDFIDCNTQALKLLDYKSKDELFAKHISELYPEIQPNGQVSKEITIELIKQALSGDSTVFEWVMKKKDNSKVFCVVALNSIESLGENLLQAVIKDVTNNRKLEHELGMATIRTEEKERIRFAKELHDGIGPILSTIKLYIEWLKEENKIEENNLILNIAFKNTVLNQLIL